MAQDSANSVANGALPYRTKTISLAIGEIKDVPGNIRFLTMVSATDLAGVSVSFNGSTFSAFPPGFNLRDFEAEIFWLKNTSAAPNVVTVAIGQADLRDSRVVIDAANPLPVTGTVAISGGSIGLTGTGSNNSDAEAVKITGLAEVETYGRVFNGATWDRQYGNTSGAFAQGPKASGTVLGGNPVLQGVSDGTNVVNMRGDANGRIQPVGIVNSGSAHGTVAPTLVGGSDATNARTFLTDTSGRLAVNMFTGGTALADNSGNLAAGVLRVVLATNSPALSTAGFLSAKIDQTTDGTTNKVAAVLRAGTTATPEQFGLSAAGVPRFAPATPTGATFTNTTASTNAANLKGSAGQVFSVTANNTTAAAKFLRLYNKATAPTTGTDTPVVVLTVPANSSKEFAWPNGLQFGTGIGVACTGGGAVLDNTNTAAGDVQFSVQWQ